MTCAATHSLKYFYTALQQSTGLPEFSTVAYLDKQPIYLYDSSTMEVVARQEWVKGAVDADFWRRNTQLLMDTEKVFKTNMDTARARFNQTSALALQKMYSCEWNEETNAIDGDELYGYGGEDYLTFDLEQERWIAPVQQGLNTKMKWDADGPKLKAKTQYLTHTCIEWLKNYVSNQSMWDRKVPPQVSLLQKEPSDRVTCHATGFYPDATMIFWRRDGVEIHDDVEHEETLPNGDGTYQKRTHLTVSPEDLQKHDYTCTVQHVSDDVVLSANRNSICSNSRKCNSSNTQRLYISIIIVSVVFALVILVVVFIKIKKFRNGKEQTSEKEKQCATSLLEKGVLLLNDEQTSEKEKQCASEY
ncbi:major histocompatibility complex class I-related gene protein-like isoform X3 [Coregonus clupeaformis]|uniref:major histocompatibility complex class I-related gene protein-like isoform X3 n=1 Tax=Coregonus clupeaformis TaxID=59861 RepID=UPI001E1C3F96|nr:major histocompatibility complex class I-related gene protein-like isoform X3 [Coregonus clupeaformis]